MSLNNVAVGVVLYEPDIVVLSKLVDSIKGQVDSFVFYLNSPVSDDVSGYLAELGCSVLLGGHENVGVAAAHSEILSYCRSSDYEYVVLSDQDTEYPELYVKKMREHALNCKVSVVCPSWVDVNSSFGAPVGQYFLTGDNSIVFKCCEKIGKLAHAISSGMFIVLKEVPATVQPDRELFIDWVDNDWCWRLIGEGVQIGFEPACVLEHSLGDYTSVVAGRRFTRRPIIRDYYIIRNAIILIFHRSYAVRVRGYMFKKLLHHLVFSVLANGRSGFAMTCSYVAKAVFHGAINRTGRL